MSLVHTYSCDQIQPAIYPELARKDTVKFAASLTLAKGTVVAQVTTGGLWNTYDDAQTNGRQVAKGILPYAITTDASGNISISGTGTGDEHFSEKTHIDIWITGYFLTSELTGLDAAGVADLGRLVSGTVADGVLAIQ